MKDAAQARHDRWAELGQVAECERADRCRHLAIGERQRGELAEAEVGVGKLGRGAIQHRLASVDADHLPAPTTQVGGVTAGAACSVEDRPRRQLVEQLSNNRLLGRDRVVAGLVVILCPLRISGVDIVSGRSRRSA